jgi:hypothetical protein
MTATTNAFSYGFINYSMTKDAQNLDCAANDLKNFVSDTSLTLFVSIRRWCFDQVGIN